MTHRTTVLLVDDVAEMRTLLRTVIQHRPNLETVAEAADGRQAVSLAAEHRPDVVVLDLGLPDLEGKEVLTRIRDHSPESRVVVFSGTQVPARAWISDRVEGFVSKEQDLSLLLEVLESVAHRPMQVVGQELPLDVRSVPRARALAEQTLGHWGLRDMAGDTAIVVSELVTNAMVHAETPCELRLSSHRTSLRVSVIDGGSGTPEPLAPSTQRLGGRGLQIVDSLATAWGVENLQDGRKLVWAELPLPDVTRPAVSPSAG